MIKEICASTTLPVNVVGVVTLSSIAPLAAAGVRRISMAGLLYKSTYARLDYMAGEMLKDQSLALLHA